MTQVALEETAKKPIVFFEYLVAMAVFIFPMTGSFLPVGAYFADQNNWSSANITSTNVLSFATDSYIHWVTILAIFWLAFRNRFVMFEAFRVALPIVVLITWFVLSSRWSLDPGNTLRRVFHMIDHAAFGFYLACRFEWRQLIAFLTRGFCVVLLLSVFMVLAFPVLGYSSLNGYQDAWRGVLTEKNFLGAVAVFGALTAGYSFVIRANRRSFSVFVCLGHIFLLLMSRSATSLGAFILVCAMLVVALAFCVHRFAPARIMALALVASGVLVGYASFLSFDSVNEMLGRSSNLTGRLGIWMAVEKLIEQRPLLGYGYGFWDATSQQRLLIWQSINFRAPHAHNEYLDCMLQVGVVGLLIEVFIFVVSLWRALQLSVVLGDGKGLYCGLVILVLCVRGYSETVLTDPVISSWIWMTMTYITLALEMKKRRRVLSPFYNV